MKTVHQFAPAKINLTLHIRGRREDGFHLIESFVAFGDVGDEITVRSHDGFDLNLSGPFVRQLQNEDNNIALEAAKSFVNGFRDCLPGVQVDLVKNLPIAAGMGGGSSDAAAVIRALAYLVDVTVSRTAAGQLAIGLGADVTVCLDPQASFMSGVGNIVTPLPALPEIHAILVNPNIKMLTGAVFAALAVPGAIRRDEEGLKPEHAFLDARDLVAFVGSCRNDLEAPALRMCPEISDVREALLAQDGCLLARMTGSGATCFGLFANSEQARRGAEDICKKASNWWVKPCRLN
jgi:4-diphosphocytidyl-2-C-methyl-D-erythritol kinase